MSIELVTERMRQADPAGEHTVPPATVVSSSALLAEIDRRSGDMQTQDKRPIVERAEPPGPPRRRWLVPAVAGGAIVIVAIALVASVFSGGDNPEPRDVATTIATNTSTTVAEPAAITPLKVVEALEVAILAGDWRAAVALYSPDATYTEEDEARITGIRDIPMAEAGAGYLIDVDYDWDGDGTKSVFDDVVAGSAIRAYVIGITDMYRCVEFDATTVVCTLVSEGDPFGSPLGKTDTFTVVDSLVVHQSSDQTIQARPGGTEIPVEYHDWVRASHPELNEDDALFEFLGKPLLIPDTVETHRQLVAEWKAQR